MRVGFLPMSDLCRPQSRGVQ